MSPIAAAVWVFWGGVVLAVVRMLLAYRRSTDTDAQVKALRAELAELRIKDRLASLEAGQLALRNQAESAKVQQLRRREWGR